MKHSVLALALVGAAAARPTAMKVKREVPQEHSHRNIINVVNDLLFLDNPDDIQDAIFGLLGAAAAAEGAGNIADPDCLQQATADQAFTNAKAAGDVDGMTNALIFRALERNTGQVGLASVLCESIEAVNPEIAAITQHQDPAGEGAQDLNKEIAAELARQIAAIGGDPLLANEASTFEPGELDDPTAAGNTCNDENDDEGCINSENLRVDDLSEDEINAAVADVEVVDDAENVDEEADDNVELVDDVNDNLNNSNINNNLNNNLNLNNLNNNNNIAQLLNGINFYQGFGQNANDILLAQLLFGAGNNVGFAQNDFLANALFGQNVFGNAIFGQQCNPQIAFANNLFVPQNNQLFAFAGAQDFNVLANAICNDIIAQCGLNNAAIQLCQQAALQAQAFAGAQAAQVFNLALGFGGFNDFAQFGAFGGVNNINNFGVGIGNGFGFKKE